MDDNDTLLQSFEWYLPEDGTFWKKLEAMAPSFRMQGISAVWLPPAYKGQGGTYDVGYGVYDMYDLGEFNQKGTVRTKYGTKDEYLSCVKALQKENIAVLTDIVFNQRMGGDETEAVMVEEDNPSDRDQDVTGPEEIDAWTKFTFPGRANQYSTFQWDHTCFDGVDWDERGHRSGVFRMADKHWDADVDNEDGNYDFLMGCDLDISEEKVQNELQDWGRWYLNLVKPQGVRLDAVKHIDFEFFDKWLSQMKQDTGIENLFAVGEYWNGDCSKLLHYLDVTDNVMSLFDVSLHFHFYDASNSNGNYDMRTIFDNTVVKDRPMNAVTFVDDHDTQPGQALTSFVNGWFKQHAYAMILLRRDGLPCVFYGDLYGIPHDSIAPVAKLNEMILCRKKYAYGNQDDYFDDQHLIGWTREGDTEHPCSGLAVLLTDTTGGEKQMYVGLQHAGEVFVDLLGNITDEVEIGSDGNGVFKCGDGSVSVWVKKENEVEIKSLIG